MRDYNQTNLAHFLASSKHLPNWTEQIPSLIAQKLGQKHGDLPKWIAALANLPKFDAYSYDLQNAVSLITSENLDLNQLEQNLQILCPWRKGPFNFFGVDIDAEWRSDWKWQRLAPHLNLDNKNVLDVGCGNGYYAWRMLGAGAKSVIGVDPSLLFYCQFLVFKQYLAKLDVWHLPLTFEQLPLPKIGFDLVFSMGVLYHRFDPIAHLKRLHEFIATNGQLVLETLIIDGDERSVLVPKDRYAQMRNVWFIPSVSLLKIWLKRLGFRHINCVSVSTTSSDEQRVTKWLEFQSLKDFLDPHNSNLTIEGLPAPKRAILLANK